VVVTWVVAGEGPDVVVSVLEREPLGQVGVLVFDGDADGKILVFVVNILGADGGLAGV
jgi:hypothetical protein